MNILHVLSQFEVTGAEVYAASLVSEQLRQGHTAYIVSDTFSTPTQGIYIPMPIGRRSYAQRVSNIRAIRKLIRVNKIDLVHAHSRAASWIAHAACRIAKTPFVSTVHGRQHIHTSSRSFNIYGGNIIAVSEDIRGHLVADLNLPAEHITIIPNGLDSACWVAPKSMTSRSRLYGVPSGIKIILFVGRLSGPKGDVVRFLVSQVLPLLVPARKIVLVIIAGQQRPNDFGSLIEHVNTKLGWQAVRLMDFQTDLRPYYRHADLVIGSGRVAMEALAAGTRTMGFGETNYVGEITSATFAEAMKSNFGDTGVRSEPGSKEIAHDILAVLETGSRKNESRSMALATRQHFSLAEVAKRVGSVYERAILKAKSPDVIPVLMYHRVVAEAPANSKHGVWVTAEKFERQLASLQKRGFSTMTFRQYDDFRNGKASLPPKPIILTFDDGYQDNYDIAFPLLRRYRSTAVVYMVVDNKRRTNYWDSDEPRVPLMTVAQMREMAQAGIEFGSHTITHARLTDMPVSAARSEIKKSKMQLERMIGQEVLSFAYPYGALDMNGKKLVEQCGYRYAVAADSGPLNLANDFFEIRRIQVFPWTTLLGFWKKTQSWYVAYKERKALPFESNTNRPSTSALKKLKR